MEDFVYKIENNKFYIDIPKPQIELDEKNITKLQELIDLGIEKGYKQININCKNLNYMNSSGLGVFVFSTKKVKITLKNLNDILKRILEITNTTQFFTIE